MRNINPLAIAAGLIFAGMMPIAPAFAQKTEVSAPKMMQAMPKDAVLVTTGKFKRVTHNTKGTATIYEFANGTRELHLKGFETDMGPALKVFLVAAGDAKDNASVTKAGYLELGALKSRKGDQVYRVPKNIDLWKYRAVTIWCDKFDVNFGTAPLAAKQ